MSSRNRRSSTKNPKDVQKVGDLHDPQRRSAFEGNEILILAATFAILLYVLWQFKDYQVLPSWDGTYYINYSIRSVFPSWLSLFHYGIQFIRVSQCSRGESGLDVFLMCHGGDCLCSWETLCVSWLRIHRGIVAGFAPLSLRMGVDTLSETTYAFFIVLAAYLYSLSIGKEKRTKEIYFAGLTLAVAYFTRPEAAVFFGLLILLETYKTRNIKGALVLLAGFATILIPLVVGTCLSTGEFIVTKKAMNFRVLDPTNWFKNEEKLTGLNNQQSSLSDLLQSTISNYGTNFQIEGSYLLTFAGIPAAILAVWYLVKKRTFLAIGLAEFFVYPIFTGLGLPQRFVYPYIPFLGILSVAAIYHYVPAKTRALAVILLLVGTIGGYSFLTTPLDAYPELRKAGMC